MVVAPLFFYSSRGSSIDSRIPIMVFFFQHAIHSTGPSITRDRPCVKLPIRVSGRRGSAKNHTVTIHEHNAASHGHKYSSASIWRPAIVLTSIINNTIARKTGAADETLVFYCCAAVLLCTRMPSQVCYR